MIYCLAKFLSNEFLNRDIMSKKKENFFKGCKLTFSPSFPHDSDQESTVYRKVNI